MGDTYNTGQAGAVGPGASASNMSFQQIWQQNSGTIGLQALSSELDVLIDALKQEATEPEHEIALGNVSAAQESAAAGDGPKALEYLRNCGKWVLGVAQKIGIGVVVAAIKAAIGP